jgi:hypothetical protein
MQIDLVVYALENGVGVLPTGETPIQLLNRISESLRQEEPVRRGGRRKREEDVA